MPLPSPPQHVLFGKGGEVSGGQAPTAERLAALDKLTGVVPKRMRSRGTGGNSAVSLEADVEDPRTRLQIVNVRDPPSPAAPKRQTKRVKVVPSHTLCRTWQTRRSRRLSSYRLP